MGELRRRGASVLALCCALLAGSCAPKATAPAAPVVVAPSEFGQDVRMVTSLLFEYGPRELLARAVVEKSGDELDLWLLTPNGVRLCHFHQEGDEITRDDRTEVCELLDPRYVLQDLRWSYFQGCVDASPCQVGDATFTERVAEGDVVQREVLWQGVEAVITFEEYLDGEGGRHPRRALIDNRTYGYSITILVETYEETGAVPSR